MYHRQGNRLKQVAKTIVGLCQGRKTALRKTFYRYMYNVEV